MAVAAVTQAFTQYAQKVVGGSTAASSAPSGSSAQQEANETASTTKSEAAHGDRQAKLKLAKTQQQQSSAPSAPASEPGKGETVDKTA
jgi:hypothetical protein